MVGEVMSEGEKANFQLRHAQVQGDQLFMVVCFWHLVNSDWCSVQVSVAYTGQVTFYIVPENTCLSGWVLKVLKTLKIILDICVIFRIELENGGWG